MSIGLTQRQTECLNFIRNTVAAGKKAPSFDEIKDAMGLRSKSDIHRLISGLEDRGYIRRLPGRSRAIAVVDPTERSSFFQSLGQDIREVISSIARAEGTTPEVVMREWVRERAESMRYVEQQRLS